MSGELLVETIFPVHDQFVFKADEGDAGRAAGVIREVMERFADLRVPLAVDVTIGRHWGEI